MTRSHHLRTYAVVTVLIALFGCQKGTLVETLVVDAANGVRLASLPAWMAGGSGEGAGQFQYLGPITMSGDGHVIAADSRAGRLIYFDLDGNVSRTRSYYPGGENPLLPSDSLSRVQGMKMVNGKLFIATGNTVWGVSEDQADRIDLAELGGYVRALEADENGRLYVLLDDWVKAFTIEGEQVFEAKLEGDPNPSSRAMTLASDGNIYVSARRWQTVVVLNGETGDEIRRIGGADDGSFVGSPRGIAVDVHGNVFVYDDGAKMLHVFDNQGTHVGTSGSRGSAPGQTLGADVLAIDYERNRLVVQDNVNYRIQVYDLTGNDAMARDLVRHESKQGATAKPDFVTLQLGNNPLTERRCNWRTDLTTGKASQMQYVKVADGSDVDWATATPEVIRGTSIDFQSNLGPYRAHEVSITGLEPGATYAYRVGDGSANGWGDTAAFSLIEKPDESLRVIVLGDSRNRMDVWKHIMTEAANQDPAFIINTGDLVSDGEQADHWNDWFYAAREVLSTVPLMTSLGNHERQSQNYFNLFALPTNTPEELREQCYSFDYGPAHFVVLNTQFDLDMQTEWLREDLVGNDKPWTFAFFHRPAYEGHPHRGDGNQDIRDAWVEIFEDNGFDIAWSGHSHYYFRTKPIRDGKTVAAGVGPVHITSGAAGAPLYPTIANQWSVVNESVDHYCIMDLTPTEAKIIVYRADGSLLDELTLQPRSSD
jgi:acid phosphatase type 7